MRRNAVLSVMLALVGLTFATRGANAQGFGVYEHDACMMGRAGTGVAAPCSNAAAIFANPAGIVNAQQTGRRWELSLGVTGIAPTFSFEDSVSGVTTDAVKNTIPVPNVYLTRQMGQLAGRYPWAIGLGVYAPYGLISEWPETFEGRFLAYYSDLKNVYIQPTMAVQFRPWLSVGAGFDYIYSKVHLNQRADLSTNAAAPGLTFGQLGIPEGTDFADAELTGSSHSAGGHIGMMITTERMNIGIRYLLHSIADIQGDAEFTQLPTNILLPASSPLQPTATRSCPGLDGDAVPADDSLRAGVGLPLDDVLYCNAFTSTLAPQHASVRVPLPDMLVIGTSIQATDAFRLMVDFQYTYWGRFKELRLVFANLGTRPQWEDYENTVGLRLGGEYRVSQSLTLRAGGLVHEAAAPAQTVTPLLPEAERSEGTLGASLRIGRNAQLDVAYQKIWQADRRGRIQEPPVRGPAGVSANTGLYTGGANLFGANLVWRF